MASTDRLVAGPPPAAQDTGREYVVLVQIEADGPLPLPSWREAGRGIADNAKQAIACIVGDEDEGTYVAVPVRSWQPVTRKIERVTKATWS